MNCLVGCSLWILVAIIVILLLVLFTFWIIYQNLQNNFDKTYRINLLSRCISDVQFQPDRGIPRDLTPEQYNYQLALTLLNTSIRVTRSACTPSLPRVQLNGYTATRLDAADPYGQGKSRQFAQVFQNDQRVVVIFDGTMFKDEWLADFDFPQIAPQELGGYQRGMMVHTGFLRVYRAVRPQLLRLWRENTDRELIIAGHSLGAAVSNLAALDLHQYQPIHYTYGCPRTGNRIWADTFNRLLPYSWRVYNAEDLITEVPPPIIFKWVYSHIGRPVTFDRNLGSVQDNHVTAYLQHLPERACQSS